MITSSDTTLHFPAMPLSDSIDEIQKQLETVTNSVYRRKIVENDDHQLLITWQNDTTCVDYLMHIVKIRHNLYQIAFAVQKYKVIETKFDQRMDKIAIRRLLNDPVKCVSLILGIAG